MMSTQENLDGGMDGGPDGVRLYHSGLALAELDLHGGVFWEEASRFSSEARLEDLVEALAGHQVVLFLDEADIPETRAVAALCVARLLGKRGRSVLVVDGDDGHPALTRWSGRFEQEGWIDLVRFGASLQAASTPLPWDPERARLLGVGSFCPVGAEPEEITGLLERLRRQADVVLVSVPLGSARSPWLAAADGRVLCWDRMRRSVAATQATAAALAAAGHEVEALIGFGVDEATLSALQPPAAAEEPAPATAGAGEEPAGEAGGGLPSGRELAGGQPAPAPAPAAGTVGAVAADRPAQAAAAAETELPPEPWRPRYGRRRSRSSPVFVRASLVLLAAAALIAIAWWYVSRPSEPQPPSRARSPVQKEVAPGSIATLGDTTPALGAADSESGRGATGGESETAGPTGTAGSSGNVEPGGSVEPEVIAGPGETAAPGGTAGPGKTAGSRGQTEAGGQTPGEHGMPGPAPGEQPPGEQPPGEPETTAEGRPATAAPAEMGPYQVPVGEAGWALWLYSQPDSSLAHEQVAELERQGIRATWRRRDVPGKGIWYRIYVGSFASKEEAVAAAPQLLARLETDWALPVRLRP